MKDHDVDRAVRDLVREEVDLPDDGLDRALAAAKQTAQERPRRWWPFGRVRRDPSATETDRELTATTTLIGGRIPLLGLGAAATFVLVVAFLAGTQFSDDEAGIVPAASGAPTPTMAAPSCVPSAGGPADLCPLIGSADITNTTRLRRTILPIRTVGSGFNGPGEAFELNYENEANELEIRGVAEPGQYRGDPRFYLGVGGPTIEGGVDTVEGSDCIIMISFVNARSMSGGFSCDDHPSIGPESPVDLSGTFETSIAERGAASAYRSDSYMEGWESQMFSYDSALFFDGGLESMAAEFPDGPMHLLFRSDDGSTMEVTGTTGAGTFTEDDGFSIVVDDFESGYFDLDPNNSDCTIEVEHSDESGIAADFGCRFVGREVGGTFEAIP